MTQVEDSGETKVKIEVPVSDEAGPVRRTMAESAPTTLSGRMAEGLQHVRGRGALEIGIIFVLVNLGCIIWYFVDKEGFPFLSEANLSVMSQSIPILALLAIGAGVLMIAGEFDLSIGANYTMSGLVFLTWYGDGRPAVLAIAVAVLVGIAIALLNGVITTRFGIPSFIVTLGAMLFWEGGALWYNGTSSAIINRSSTLESVFAGNIFNIR